jgi:parallel beta-helix repeat protein
MPLSSNLVITVPKGVYKEWLDLIQPFDSSGSTLARWVDTVIAPKPSGRGLLFTATGIGLIGITLLYFSDSGVTLEVQPQQLAQVPSSNQTIAQAKVLFVKPSVENDGNGSESAPFKTITRALEVAEPNSTIVLSPGTYDESSGETFPIRLKPGVSIQGDSKSRGSNIAIKGGGTFMSPTFARQNITILGANQASMSGVTVTNPNPRGYGLWIESSSPVVSENTFTGNSHDGISITGNSSPTVRSNYFYKNGANGITIYGTSRPEVRENVFEETGFGINIAQKAAPLLVGNRITKNRSGIVAQANARPVLRDNVIEGNTEDGVVAIANSQPDMGTKAEPGKNVFRQNGRYDINTSAAKLVIPAFGNQLANAQTSGNVDLAGTTEVSAVVTTAPTPQPVQNSQIARTSNNNVVKKIPVVAQPKPAASPPASEAAPPLTSRTPIAIPVPPPGATVGNPPQNNPARSPQPATASGSDNAITIAVPPAPSQPLTPPPAQNDSITKGLPVLEPAQVLTSELLPVPNSNIPIGNSRNLPRVNTPRSTATSSDASPPLPPTRATALGLRYRVVVEADNASKQANVRSLIPGAFRTVSKGRVYMQLGAFSDRAKADEMLQLAKSKGLSATIEELN